MSGFRNVYDDERRAAAYAELAFPGTYQLAFRDLPRLFEEHGVVGRALDFGCGAGRSTRFLRDRGFEVVGVDISRPMLELARAADPRGDYRPVDEGNLGDLDPGSFDLVLSAFTFDNIPTAEGKQIALRGLVRLLAPRGHMVSIVSTPEIYLHEWASFSTRDYPQNREARSGDPVRIVMLDVSDGRPVEDVVCTDEDYRELFRRVGLSPIVTHRPLATGSEPVDWKSETEIAPWAIYVLGRNGIREAVVADAGDLADLSVQLGYAAGRDDIEGRLRRIRERRGGEVLVTEVGGRVRGWIHVEGAHRLESGSFAEIGGLVIDAAHRGQGLGSALVAAAEGWAAARGLDLMRVRSNVTRGDAHRFYLRLGYSENKRQAVFDRKLPRPPIRTA